MEIKIRGGSTLVVPHIEGATLATPLKVFMEPGALKTERIVLKADYESMLRDDTTHSEYVEEHTPDVLDADVDLYPDIVL